MYGHQTEIIKTLDDCVNHDSAGRPFPDVCTETGSQTACDVTNHSPRPHLSFLLSAEKICRECENILLVSDFAQTSTRGARIKTELEEAPERISLRVKPARLCTRWWERKAAFCAHNQPVMLRACYDLINTYFILFFNLPILLFSMIIGVLLWLLPCLTPVC